MLSRFVYDEVYTPLSTVNSVKIYFNERLYDLFVGVPCEFDTGEFKYRLRVVYNFQTWCTRQS